MIINLMDYQSCIYGNILRGGGTVYVREIAPDCLLQTSAGVRIKFTTDSKSVEVLYQLEIKPIAPHIGRSMVNCINYAIWDADTNKPIKIECLSTPGKFEMVFQQESNKKLNYEFYLPSFNRIDSFELIIDDNAKFEAEEKVEDSPLVFLGGPFTLGSGCTFATAMFSSILSRKLKRDYYNFGIYTHKYLSLEIASAIASLRPSVVIVEAESVGIDLGYMYENLSDYLLSILRNTVSPIVLLTQPFWGDIGCHYKEKINFVKKVAKELSETYPGRIILLDGAKVFDGIDYDRYSYSLNFLNDYGNYILAEYMLPILQSHLF